MNAPLLTHWIPKFSQTKIYPNDMSLVTPLNNQSLFCHFYGKVCVLCLVTIVTGGIMCILKLSYFCNCQLWTCFYACYGYYYTLKNYTTLTGILRYKTKIVRPIIPALTIVDINSWPHSTKLNNYKYWINTRHLKDNVYQTYLYL